MNETGSSIVWETARVEDDTIVEGSERWWRNLAPPFGMVDELICNVND